ncbi:UBN2 domain-containing protein [Cephalotus follicularis]|uniref:UBN2 domain-containing protein n=1 Tax=Cephalotus follicularis TaxID=3775 RepID=A0A1Q3AR05_CEPFO|nr:UBN2 domain-containing protein [Cephalotus follicularis]
MICFSVNNNTVSIEVLTESNYKKWKQYIEFAIGIADIDLAMISNMPADITDTSSLAERVHHAKWERSNKLCLMVIKRSISEHLLGGLPETNDAREFFATVGEIYQVSSNAEARSLMSEPTGLRYDGLGGVREHILRMVHLQSKLRARDIPFPDSYIVSHALNSLPISFSQIKIAYNTQSKSWSINDLITKCVAEEKKTRKKRVTLPFLCLIPNIILAKVFVESLNLMLLESFRIRKMAIIVVNLIMHEVPHLLLRKLVFVIFVRNLIII